MAADDTWITSNLALQPATKNQQYMHDVLAWKLQQLEKALAHRLHQRKEKKGKRKGKEELEEEEEEAVNP